MKTQMVTGSMRRSAAILAIAIAVVGCTAAKQTQKIVILPTSTPTEMPTAEPTPTPMPSESPSGSPSGSPSASLTASPTPPPAGGGVESCTGTADMRDLWKEAANNLSFDVYCAVLPSSWWVQNTEWKGKPLTYVTISYKNAKGWLISVGEGNFCSGAPLCWTSISDLGAASFGDRAGQLKLRAAGQYAVYVDAGTTHGYQIIGQGMSQSDLVAWAAGMVKVARS